MSDRPQGDGGGPESTDSPDSQGGAPYSLSKDDGTSEPSYGYGPPAYGDPTSPDPSYGGPSAYGGPPEPTSYGSAGYSDQSTPYAGEGYHPGAEQPPTSGYDPQGGYAAPAAGASYGGYGAPAPAGGYGTTPAPKKKRAGLVIGIIAGALVVIVGLAIGLVALLSDSGAKPSAVVKSYLEALAQGDAPKALDQGAKPPDTTFATSAALKAQQDLAKISAVEVNDGYRSGNRARVTATYRFGDKQANETYTLTKIGGDWKIDDTVYPVDLTDLDDVPDLTLMGIDTAGKDKAYVFPGPLVWGSSNEYFTVKESNSDDFTLSPSDGSYAYSSLETDLSDAGKTAVAKAVSTFVTACSRVKDLTPENCPQREYDYQAVDGTAVWKAPSDLSALEYRTSTPVTKVYVSGDLTWSVTYTAEDYNGARKSVSANDVDGSLYGTVDLTKNPPVYTE